jgi:hypothetical protein
VRGGLAEVIRCKADPTYLDPNMTVMTPYEQYTISQTFLNTLSLCSICFDKLFWDESLER